MRKLSHTGACSLRAGRVEDSEIPLNQDSMVARVKRISRKHP